MEAVDKDADHLSITALTRCLQIDLSIAYLDLSGNQFGQVESAASDESGTLPVDFHRFETVDGQSKVPYDQWSNLALLYRYAVTLCLIWSCFHDFILTYALHACIRPGHYDLIYQEG